MVGRGAQCLVLVARNCWAGRNRVDPLEKRRFNQALAQSRPPTAAFVVAASWPPFHPPYRNKKLDDTLREGSTLYASRNRIQRPAHLPSLSSARATSRASTRSPAPWLYPTSLPTLPHPLAPAKLSTISYLPPCICGHWQPTRF